MTLDRTADTTALSERSYHYTRPLIFGDIHIARSIASAH